MTEWAWPRTKVLRVVDGDTLDVLVSRDMGFGAFASFPIRLRLARINAPTLTSPAGKAARNRLVQLLDAPAVDIVTLKPYKYGGGGAGSVGEYMAEVTLPDGRNASDVMVTEGHAVPWSGRGPRPSDDGAAPAVPA